MKKLLLTILLTASALLSGCIDATQLNERLLVQAIGIDFYDGIYTVTVQAFQPSGKDKNENNSSSRIYQITGDSITAALERISRQSGKKVFLGSNRFVVVAESAATERMSQIVSFLGGHHEIRPKTMLIISRSSAEKVVSAGIDGGTVPAQAIESMVSLAAKNGYCYNSSIMSVARGLEAKEESVPITYIDIAKAYDDKTTVEILGAAVMSGNDIKCHLTKEECRGAQWISGGILSTTMVLGDEHGNRFNVSLRPILHTLSAHMSEENVPMLDILLVLDCSVAEIIKNDGYGMADEDIPQLTQMIERGVYQESALAKNKLLTDADADIFYLQKYLKKYCKEYYFTQQKNINNVYSKVKLNLETKVNISCTGIGFNSVLQ